MALEDGDDPGHSSEQLCDPHDDLECFPPAGVGASQVEAVRNAGDDDANHEEAPAYAAPHCKRGSVLSHGLASLICGRSTLVARH